MTELPPIPDEAYIVHHETYWSTRSCWGALEAAYPIIAAEILRWAAGQINDWHISACDPVETLRAIAEEVSRGD